MASDLQNVVEAGEVGFLPLPLGQRLIPILGASVLFTAAVLKTHALWIGPVAGPGIFGSPWVQVLVIEVEIAAGTALLFGFRPRVTRLASMLLFSAFFGLALSKAGDGASSCACFGLVQAHPLATAGLDGAMLMLLAFWQPIGTAQELLVKRPGAGVVLSRVWSRVLAAGVLTAAVAFPLSLVSSDTLSAGPMLLSAAPIELGTLRQGGRIELLVPMQNLHERQVVVSELSSSCPCLSAQGLPWQFAAHEKRNVRLLVDLAKQPGYVGHLSIQFSGWIAERQEAIRGEVRVRVVPGS